MIRMKTRMIKNGVTYKKNNNKKILISLNQTVRYKLRRLFKRCKLNRRMLIEKIDLNISINIF